MKFPSFNCSNIVDITKKQAEPHLFRWYCTKRHSYFYSTYDHCFDCDNFQKMLSELKKVVDMEDE